MSSRIYAPAPEPETPLGRYRVLGPACGLKVSPLCLGAMNFGDAWKDFMGECNKDTVFDILDAFYKAGGNFIDTANNYQDQESEQWIGEWMESRKNRDDLVIATKVPTPPRLSAACRAHHLDSTPPTSWAAHVTSTPPTLATASRTRSPP